jgi:hypothetical protein
MGCAVGDDWRDKLDAVWGRYQIDRNPETMQEYRRLLKQFADLILRGKRPRNP